MAASFETTGTFDPNDIIAGNAHLLIAEVVTVLSGQVLPRGAVVGKITTGGKYTLSLAGASDGSEDPHRIIAEAVDASGGDVSALVYKRGDFRADQLTYGTGHTAATVKTALGDDANIQLI